MSDKKGLDVLSDEFCAAAALAALSKSTAQEFADRIDANLKKYPNINPEKRQAFEQTRDWLREC
jgi:hypothetical protein